MLPSSSEPWRSWAVGLCGNTPASRAATDEDLRRSIAAGLTFRRALLNFAPQALLSALELCRQQEQLLRTLGETLMLRQLEEPLEVLQ